MSADSDTAGDTILIRPAKAGDADLLSLIGGATFLDGFHDTIASADIVAHVRGPHGADYYRRALADPACAAWLAVHGKTGAPIGYQMLTPPDLPVETGADDIELKRIYILSRYHGTGVARRLFAAAETEALSRGKTRLLLGVYAGNDRGIGFYRKSGFETIGSRQFTVGTQQFDDIVMARNL